MAILIDTNFLLAVIFPRDVNHQQAAKAIQSLETTKCIVPLPVLQELFYMTSVRLNYETAIDYCERIYKAALTLNQLPKLISAEYFKSCANIVQHHLISQT